MTTPTTMKERFEKEFNSLYGINVSVLNSEPVMIGNPPIVDLLSFIQSEINLAVEKREKEIVDMVSEYPEKLIKIMPSGKLPFVIFGGKADEEEKKTIYFQAFKDVINLIIKK